jgi:2-methylisocitrate lyase-like PEP mutase family enzyme
LQAYKEAGADMLMVLGPYDISQARKFITNSPAPHAYLDSESFTMPMIPVKELERLGAKLAIFPLAITLSVAHAVRRTLKVIRESGTTEAYAKENMLSWAECNDVLGFREIQDQEKKYV